MQPASPLYSLSFFNHSATPEIYTLSLHDALPISCAASPLCLRLRRRGCSQTRRRSAYPKLSRRAARRLADQTESRADRKSTRLNSSHGYISYAVFCLKKKKKNKHNHTRHTHTLHS